MVAFCNRISTRSLIKKRQKGNKVFEGVKKRPIIEDKDVFILYFDEEINRNFDPEKDKEFEKDLKDDEKTYFGIPTYKVIQRIKTSVAEGNRLSSSRRSKDFPHLQDTYDNNEGRLTVPKKPVKRVTFNSEDTIDRFEKVDEESDDEDEKNEENHYNGKTNEDITNTSIEVHKKDNQNKLLPKLLIASFEDNKKKSNKLNEENKIIDSPKNKENKVIPVNRLSVDNIKSPFYGKNNVNDESEEDESDDGELEDKSSQNLINTRELKKSLNSLSMSNSSQENNFNSKKSNQIPDKGLQNRPESSIDVQEQNYVHKSITTEELSDND